LALWAQIMMSGDSRVLSLRSTAAAQKPQEPLHHYGGRPSSIGGGHYGFGLFIDEYPDAKIVWHSGGIPGWVAWVGWIPEQRFAVAMLGNSWPDATNGLKNAVECIFAEERGVTMPDMSEPSDTSTWRPYAGSYDAIYDDGFEFEVFVEYENGQLSMTAPNPNNPDQMVTRVLENIHASTFRFRPDSQSYWDMTFLRGNGKWAPVRWLRNSRFVGLRRLVPRRAGVRLSP
jgi:CubicO group peptidase (beta-lactamase class C family)